MDRSELSELVSVKIADSLKTFKEELAEEIAARIAASVKRSFEESIESAVSYREC